MGMDMSGAREDPMRFVAPATVWRYHGAEHKAVAAHEEGIALDDLAGVLACPRVHPRCGTNLVVLVALIGILLQRQPAIIQVLGFLLGVAVAAEVLTLAGRWPRSPRRSLRLGPRRLSAHRRPLVPGQLLPHRPAARRFRTSRRPVGSRSTESRSGTGSAPSRRSPSPGCSQERR